MTSTGSLNETGTESGSGSYVLNKTTTGYLNTSSIDGADGESTMSGTEGTSSTAIETNAHGSYGATFTEILASNDTLSQSSDDQAGEYTLSQSGSNSANFVDDGTDADGTFHVTEGSAGSFSSDTLGDSNNADYTTTATTSTGYSYSEIVSGSSPFTETENGSITATSTETGDQVTGAYTRNETGTDLYTLTESGTLSGTGTFAETVTGTDNYSVNDVGNTALQTDVTTTTGGGAWMEFPTKSGHWVKDFWVTASTRRSHASMIRVNDQISLVPGILPAPTVSLPAPERLPEGGSAGGFLPRGYYLNRRACLPWRAG